MSKVCRCCLVEGTSMKNFFLSGFVTINEDAEDLTLAEAYKRSTNINLFQDSNLPNDICVNCEEKLIASYKFLSQCRSANTVLNNLNESNEINENFWDSKFLYNVPSISNGDFFTDKEAQSFNLQCTYEIQMLDTEDKNLNKEARKDRKTERKTYYKCTGCQKEFSMHNFYRVHCEKLHSSDWECEYCDERFTAHTYLAHKRLHTDRPLFECNRCYAVFMAKPSLSKHRCPVAEYLDETEVEIDDKISIIEIETVPLEIIKTRVSKINPVKFTCDECNEEFTNKSKYETHIKRHKNKIIQKNKTESFDEIEVKIEDNKEFVIKIEAVPLEIIKTRVSKKNPVTCNECNEEFTNRSKYEIHIKRHKKKTIQKNKTYLCNVCGNNFASCNSYREHVRIHTGEKPYHCDICGKRFRQTTTLRNHKQLHTGKRVLCELCPKRFASTGFLAIHMRSHNNDRAFKCELCNKSYFMKHALKEHIRAKHALIRYKCSYCENDFTSPGEKKIHETIHTGKLWWCPKCDYKSTTRNTLKTHIAKVHNLSIDELNVEKRETETDDGKMESND